MPHGSRKKGDNLNMKYCQLIRPNHPANYMTLDLVQIPDLDLNELSQIQFTFEKEPNQVEIKMEDCLHSVPRSFKYNKFKNSRPKMELQNLAKNMFRYCTVRLNQKIFVENDPGKSCKNYISTKYSDCDDKFNHQILKQNYHLGSYKSGLLMTNLKLPHLYLGTMTTSLACQQTSLLYFLMKNLTLYKRPG